jgi:hypothetical protein
MSRATRRALAWSFAIVDGELKSAPFTFMAACGIASTSALSARAGAVMLKPMMAMLAKTRALRVLLNMVIGRLLDVSSRLCA